MRIGGQVALSGGHTARSAIEAGRAEVDTSGSWLALLMFRFSSGGLARLPAERTADNIGFTPSPLRGSGPSGHALL